MRTPSPSKERSPLLPASAVRASQEIESDSDEYERDPEKAMREITEDKMRPKVQKVKVSRFVYDFQLAAGRLLMVLPPSPYDVRTWSSVYPNLEQLLQHFDDFKALLGNWGGRVKYFHEYTLPYLSRRKKRENEEHSHYVSKVRSLLYDNGDLDDEYLSSFAQLAVELEDSIACIEKAVKLMESVLLEGNGDFPVLIDSSERHQLLRRDFVVSIPETLSTTQATNVEYVLSKEVTERYQMPVWKAMLCGPHLPEKLSVQQKDTKTYEEVYNLLRKSVLKAKECHRTTMDLGGLATRLQPQFEKWMAYVDTEEAKIEAADASKKAKSESEDGEEESVDIEMGNAAVRLAAEKFHVNMGGPKVQPCPFKPAWILDLERAAQKMEEEGECLDESKG